MRIAVIGAGFVGLAAGVELVDKGHEVVVFEAAKKPGGLAGGFGPKEWSWQLEKYYHHIFANDGVIIEMAEKVGLPAFFSAPKTDAYRVGVVASLDSPVSLLAYPGLSWWGKIRMGVGLVALKAIFRPEWGSKLERYKVVSFLPRLVGREGYRVVWEPLLRAKFGRYLAQVNMAWFWARVYKRTKSLGYFKGGFEKLAAKMVKYIEDRGGEVKLGVKISRVPKGFDKVLLTVPMPLVNKLVGKKIADVPQLDYLWGQTLVLELSESLMGTYWLNILEKDWPFLVVVEHTRFVDKKHYGGKHVIYLGNYLGEKDKRLAMNEKELLALFLPYLKKVNAKFNKKWVTGMWKWQSPFAQPVFPVDHSKRLPGFETKDPDVWVANMSMVYPWDRGTNYAVEMGVKVAKKIVK